MLCLQFTKEKSWVQIYPVDSDESSYLPEYSFSKGKYVNEEDADRTSSDVNGNCIEGIVKMQFQHCKVQADEYEA